MLCYSITKKDVHAHLFYCFYRGTNGMSPAIRDCLIAFATFLWYFADNPLLRLGRILPYEEINFRSSSVSLKSTDPMLFALKKHFFLCFFLIISIKMEYLLLLFHQSLPEVVFVVVCFVAEHLLALVHYHHADRLT